VLKRVQACSGISSKDGGGLDARPVDPKVGAQFGARLGQIR
jgi:hypothetical protein